MKKDFQEESRNIRIPTSDVYELGIVILVLNLERKKYCILQKTSFESNLRSNFS